MTLDKHMQELWQTPMPVDMDFRDTRHIGGLKDNPRLPMGPQARGALAIFDEDEDLQHYTRSPWSTLKADFRELLMRTVLVRTPGDLNHAMNDVNGNGFTFRTNEDSSSSTAAEHWGIRGGQSNNQTRVGWGTDGTAATGNEDNLLGAVTQLDASSVAYDDTNFIVNVSGSSVYGGAGTTAREIALQIRADDITSTTRIILVDRSVITPTAVATSDTVSVSYQAQF